jgi:putative membrane protein
MDEWQQSNSDLLDDPDLVIITAASEPAARTRLAREQTSDGDEPAIWKGLVAGLAGGLAASWAMNQVQSQLAKISPQPAQQTGDDATVKAASAISESVGDHVLNRDEKAVAGPAIHYAFGSTMGAVYGGLTEALPRSAAGWGLPFGALLWLGADEIAVPSLGLSGSPADAPVSTHASALASHLVYGVTADAVRRAVRAAL